MSDGHVIKTDKKPRVGSGVAGPGRPKGMANKKTKAIKDMIVAALDDVGGQAYFVKQARENPVAFLGLIGKIIPLQTQTTGEFVFRWEE
jgi:hypothetical protein